MRLSGAQRQQIWLHHFGPVFSHKCYTRWCRNQINVFAFHCGHNKPVSRGGGNSFKNVFPICSNCNLSMGTLTLSSWNNRHSVVPNKHHYYCSIYVLAAVANTMVLLYCVGSKFYLFAFNNTYAILCRACTK